MQMQTQGAGPSTVQGTTFAFYSKKVEIFTDPGEYNGSKAKFEEWWAKAQAWLKVNEHAIPASSQDAIGTILSWLKGPKAGPFIQVHLMQVAHRTYKWDQLIWNVEGLFWMTNKKDWASKELWELNKENFPLMISSWNGKPSTFKQRLTTHTQLSCWRGILCLAWLPESFKNGSGWRIW